MVDMEVMSIGKRRQGVLQQQSRGSYRDISGLDAAILPSRALPNASIGDKPESRETRSAGVVPEH
jgi:hypothetical protein